MIDILVIRSNAIVHSPRVRKIATSLSKRYSVLVLGWNRDSINKEIVSEYVTDLQLFGMRAPYGKPRLILYYPIFWIWVFIKLLVFRPSVIHACDLDTVIPCFLYKIILRKMLVFDVCDRYAMAYISPKFRILYKLVNLLEEAFSKKSDALVTVSQELLMTFSGRPKHSTVIMNCATDHYAHRPVVERNILTIAYTGPIIKNRGLERIISAIEGQINFKLAIAGKIIDREFYNEIRRLDVVEYKGQLQLDDAIQLEGDSDVIAILYDLAVPINNFSMSNKLFEAIMLGIPVITNVSTQLVRQLNCGIVVDYNDVNQIRNALLELRNNIQLRKTLGDNGRRAFLGKYSWNHMESELYNIYRNLIL